MSSKDHKYSYIPKCRERERGGDTHIWNCTPSQSVMIIWLIICINHPSLVLCGGKVPMAARHRLREAGIIAVEVSVFHYVHYSHCCVAASFSVPCYVFFE